MNPGRSSLAATASPGPAVVTPRSSALRPMGHRRVLPGRQERNRPRPLPGPHLPRLVPARHLVDARPRPACRPTRPSKHPDYFNAPHNDHDDLIPGIVTEIHRLLAALILPRTRDTSRIRSVLLFLSSRT